MKLLRHDRDEVGDYQSRVLLHILPGFLMGLLPGLSGLFIRYEENEDVHTKDQAWKDYAGAMYGYIPGRIALLSSITWLTLKAFELLECYIKLRMLELIAGG